MKKEWGIAVKTKGGFFDAAARKELFEKLDTLLSNIPVDTQISKEPDNKVCRLIRLRASDYYIGFYFTEEQPHEDQVHSAE